MKKQSLVIMGALILVLTGCTPIPSVVMKNSITFTVGSPSFDTAVVFKNTWPVCGNFSKVDATGKRIYGIKQEGKYLINDHHCKVSPEGYVPEEIAIEYAPWLTLAQQNEIPELRAKEVYIIGDKIENGVKYTGQMLGRDEEAAKYNGTVRMKNVELALDKLPASAWKKIVLHPPELVSKYRLKTPDGSGDRLRGKEIHYIITLNPDGSYKIEDKLYWVSPYSKNWN